MAAITLKNFLELENFKKKYSIKVFVSARQNDNSYKVKDETASVFLTVEEGAEESNKMISPGIFMRLVNPKKIDEDKISMPKKSSSSVTKVFSLGSNLSPEKTEDPKAAEKSDPGDKNKILESLMAPLFNSTPKQVCFFDDYYLQGCRKQVGRVGNC